MNSVSFTAPTDYSTQLADIERQRKLAEAMQQQGMQPLETQTAGGWVVPISPWQGAAKLAQAFMGARGQSQASDREKSVAKQYQDDLAKALAGAQAAQTGTPAIASPSDELGGGPGAPAVGPNRQAMIQSLMSHPATQQMAMAQMSKDMDAEDRKRKLADAMGIATGQGGSQGGSNVMAGMPPQIVALMTSGDPELVKLGTTLMEANKGIAQRPGAPVVNPFTGAVIAQPTPAVPPGVALQVGPGGPQAYPVPGAQGAMGALTQSQASATEAGKAPYQLTTLNTAGAPTLMTHEQAIEAATGKPMLGAKQGSWTAQGPINESAMPPEQQAAVRALRAGVRGTATFPPSQAPGLRLQDQGEGRAQVEMGEGLGKRYNSIQDAGFSANQKMQKFERLGNLLSSVETGKLTPAGTELSAWAKSAGFNVGEKLDNAQAAKAMSNEMALELRNPSGGAGMPGAMSDADRNYLQGIIASIDKTPGANKLLLDGMRKLAQRDREVAQMARDYKKKNGSFDDGFYDELAKFSDANPLFKGTQLNSASGLTKDEAAELQQLRSKYGR